MWRRKSNKDLQTPVGSADAHKDADGHIKQMLMKNGRKKLSHKEKRKQDRNAKKQHVKQQPQAQEKRGKKRKHQEDENSDDLFHDDGLLRSEKRQKDEEDYESDNSDIVDDLSDKKKTQGNIVIDERFLKEMNANETPDDRIMRALENKLGIAKKKKRKEKKLREMLQKTSDGAIELKEFVEQKRLEKKKREVEKKAEEDEEEEEEEEMTEDPEGDAPVNDYDEDFNDGFYDGKGDIFDDLNDLLDFSKESVLDRDSVPKKQEEQEEESNDDEEENQSDEENKDEEQVDEQPKDEKSKDGKYLPPHLRNKERDDTYHQFQKQLRGLVNRLTLGNIVNITNQSIELYQKSSKNGKSFYITTHENRFSPNFM
jgi:hypothetical protein